MRHTCGTTAARRKARLGRAGKVINKSQCNYHYSKYYYCTTTTTNVITSRTKEKKTKMWWFVFGDPTNQHGFVGMAEYLRVRLMISFSLPDDCHAAVYLGKHSLLHCTHKHGHTVLAS